MTAYSEAGHPLKPADYAKHLFAWDEASFYGNFLDYATFDGREGIRLDDWGLLSLFSQDRFLSFIDWNWDELASLCLSTAPSIKDQLEQGVPMPDFSALHGNGLSWRLPDSIIDEFDEDHWHQPLSGNETITTLDFVGGWYSGAISESLLRNPETKERWEHALHSLQSSDLKPEELTAYFTDDRWQKWLHMAESPLPFTT